MRLTQNRVSTVTHHPLSTQKRCQISAELKERIMHRDHGHGRLGRSLLKYNSFSSQARRCCLIPGNYTAQARGKHIFFLCRRQGRPVSWEQHHNDKWINTKEKLINSYKVLRHKVNTDLAVRDYRPNNELNKGCWDSSTHKGFFVGFFFKPLGNPKPQGEEKKTIGAIKKKVTLKIQTYLLCGNRNCK